MENKKKGLFAGFCSVFSFTAEQNMKGKGFKFSSILIGLLICIIFAAIPIIMAVAQKPDEEGGKDDYNIEENMGDLDEGEMMDAIAVAKNGVIPQGMIEEFLVLCGYGEVKVEYYEHEIQDGEGGEKDFFKYCTENYKRPLALIVSEEKDQTVMNFYTFDGGKVSEDQAEGFAASFQMYYEDMKYQLSGLPEETVKVLTMPVWTAVETAGGEEKEMGVVIAQMIVPALFSLLLFMMTVMYGQSITKVVMAEKSSKLMEVLLTSVRPYGLIAGKIAAMAAIAIAQMVIWVVLGVLGFFIGCKIGGQIYPDYQNYILEIIKLVQESGTGFSIGAVTVAVLMTLTGFVMYCVWAGFIASAVDKVDDVSTAMSLFQIPVMLGFLISYIGSLLEMDVLIKAAEYIPVVSPFVMPADVLMGKASFAGGAASFLILALFTMGLVLLTGRVYRNKIFNKK